MASSNAKAFKDKSFLALLEEAIDYLNKCLKIFELFVYSTNVLQGQVYSTAYKTFPLIFNLNRSMTILRKKLPVSQ